MTKHKIVLVPFPFDDLSTTKVRPAVCLTNPVGINRHIVLAFITSQRPSDLMATDVVFDADRPDFARTGLRVTSWLRLHRLITLTTSVIQRDLGLVSPVTRSEIDDKLRKLFELR